MTETEAKIVLNYWAEQEIYMQKISDEEAWDAEDRQRDVDEQEYDRLCRVLGG